MSEMFSFLPLKAKDDVRAATSSAGVLAKSLSSSSEMPSEKYSFSGSPLIFAKGSTAMEFFAGTAALSGCGRGRRRIARYARKKIGEVPGHKHDDDDEQAEQRIGARDASAAFFAAGHARHGEPGDEQREGEAGQKEDDERAQHPGRRIEGRQRDIRNLYEEPPGHGVSERDAVEPPFA